MPTRDVAILAKKLPTRPISLHTLSDADRRVLERLVATMPAHVSLPAPVPSHAVLPSTVPVHADTGPTIGPPVGGGEMLPSFAEIQGSDNPAYGVSRQVLAAMAALNQMPTGEVGGQELETVGGMPLMPGDFGGLAALKAYVKDVKGSALAGRAFENLAETLHLGDTVGTYRLKPAVVRRLRSLYELGTSAPRTSNWAGAPSEELIQAFGGDEDAALMWARYWGATSPNTSVPRNTQESVRAWLRTLEHPDAPFTVPRSQQMGITQAPAKVPNLNRAMWNEPLSPGTKVEAMAEFMAGRERIPVDVHTLYALTGQKTTLDPQYKYLRALMTQAEGLPPKITKGVGLTKIDLYKRYEEALATALREIDPERPVTAVFADLWEGARAHKGRAPQGGPIDILRKKGLLEIGAMLDPTALRAALRQQGWTAKGIAGLLASLGLADAATPGEASEQDAGGP